MIARAPWRVRALVRRSGGRRLRPSPAIALIALAVLALAAGALAQWPGRGGFQRESPPSPDTGIAVHSEMPMRSAKMR